MNGLSRLISAVSICILAGAAAVSGQVATGGSYALGQAVVAGGGGTSTGGGTYKVEGTAGQTAAGANMTGGVYAARGGFWAPNLFAPTAAAATVAGQVVGLNDQGLGGVRVVLTGGPLVTPRTALTNSFGRFTFDDIEIGHTYVISVESRRYGFPQASQAFSLIDSVTDLVFRAGWEN